MSASLSCSGNGDFAGHQLNCGYLLHPSSALEKGERCLRKYVLWLEAVFQPYTRRWEVPSAAAKVKESHMDVWEFLTTAFLFWGTAVYHEMFVFPKERRL